jgi:hypothetical protein
LRLRGGKEIHGDEALTSEDEPVKLTTNTQVSVDGVVQANGGRNEEFDPEWGAADGLGPSHRASPEIGRLGDGNPDDRLGRR